MDQLTILVTLAPVISGADATLADVEVLGVVDVLVGPRVDAVYDAGLEVDQDGTRDIAGVVALVVEDILAVAALGRKVLQVPVLVDPMLLAELLPELTANCISVSALLVRARIEVRRRVNGNRGTGDYSLLLPHWPAWIVMISLPAALDMIKSLG